MVAIIPTATMPHPDTAVNDPAASIVSRMNARLSIARTCSAGGSGAGARCRGVTDAILSEPSCWIDGCQVLCVTKQTPVFILLCSLLPQSDRSGQGVAGGKALLDHFVEPPLVNGIGQQLYEPGTECGQVFGLATREQLLIELHLLVHPGPAGVFYVGLQAWPRRDRPSPNAVGFVPHPGSVTNGG